MAAHAGLLFVAARALYLGAHVTTRGEKEWVVSPRHVAQGEGWWGEGGGGEEAYGDWRHVPPREAQTPLEIAIWAYPVMVQVELLRCSVLQGGAQCGAMWCRVVQHSVVQCGAVWCSVSQCVAACCSMLQHGAVSCSVS